VPQRSAAYFSFFLDASFGEKPALFFCWFFKADGKKKVRDFLRSRLKIEWLVLAYRIDKTDGWETIGLLGVRL